MKSLVSINSKEFLSIYKRIKWCAAKDLRPPLQGIWIRLGDKVKMTASEGHVIADTDLSCVIFSKGESPLENVCLGNEILPEVVALAKESDTLLIELDAETIYFNRKFSSPNPKHKCPGFDIILKSYAPVSQVTVLKDSLVATLKTIKGEILIDQNLKLVIGPTTFSVSPFPLQEWQKDHIITPISSFGKIECGFDFKFLKSLAEQCPEKNFTLKFTDYTSPLTHESAGIKFILMPIRLGEWHKIEQPKKKSVLQKVEV